jgi:hypothetical protein
VIRYAIQVDPRSDARAEYAIRLLLEGIGVASSRVIAPSEADLAYSAQRPPDLPDRGLWVNATPLSDWDSTTGEVVWSSELPLIRGNDQPQAGRSDSRDIPEDIVYSTYAIVTGALEREQSKDAWGVPIARHSRLSREGLLERPVVAMYCSHLASMLSRRRQEEIEIVPRWPMDKKYAVVLTHDVDKPFTREPWAFYLRRLRMNLSGMALRPAGRGLLQMVKVAAVTRMAEIKDAVDDPNFRFVDWIDFEASLPATSCFYVAVTTSADSLGSPVDVNYDFRHPDVVAQLQRAVDTGWEVGLHASVNAHRIPNRLHDERALLESVLGGHEIRGVRHHYWALDPELPERTLWQHADAGLAYDSSLGLNDSPGFRRGMMWPFQPFDKERAEEVPILEVPPTMMDGSIFYRNVTAEEGRGRIEAHLNEVKELGGAAVLDWHLEQLNPSRLHGAGPVLTSVLAELANDSDAYWATPEQVAAWWQTRRELITASAQ